jgi:quinoprotein glucose dehydrogenase
MARAAIRRPRRLRQPERAHRTILKGLRRVPAAKAFVHTGEVHLPPSRVLVLLASLSLGCAGQAQVPSPNTPWPTYGGDPGGRRYTSSTQVSPTNVASLRVAWMFHTHALDRNRQGRDDASFESTPVLLGHTLYLTSPFDEVFALDPSSGRLLWTFDPAVTNLRDGQLVTSRGVALWPAAAAEPDPQHPCATRVLLGTLDARLIALDASTGKPCADFGDRGTIDLHQGVATTKAGDYGMTSPPTVVGDVVVAGSAIADNRQAEIGSGAVRGFDVRSGRLLWTWQPLQPQTAATRTGAANTWGAIAADPATGLVYLPTSSPSPDFYGGLRPGDNRDADSLVALDARTGRKVWAFQTVHHDLWDYDIAAEPILVSARGSVPAVAILTKSAQVFVLDRRTGDPLFPVEEKPVPQRGVPGEPLSPTQPFSTVDSLAPMSLPPDASSTWRRNPENAAFCRAQIQALRYDGPYTPPTLQGSLLYPGSLGGVNWGSAAFDPVSGILYANTNRYAFSIRLLRRNSIAVQWRVEGLPLIRDWPFWVTAGTLSLVLFCFLRRSWWPGIDALLLAMAVAAIAGIVVLFPYHPNYHGHFSQEISAQEGTPYLVERQPLLDHDGNPCIAPPWGTLAAVNLNSGKIQFRVPLGRNPRNEDTGTLSLGGPIVTASGLVFDAATLDGRLRAFDALHGTELWSAALPAPAQSTPMSYTLDGRQFIVVAAGGHAQVGQQRGDTLVAFALP